MSPRSRLVIALLLAMAPAPTAHAEEGRRQPGILVLTVEDFSAPYIRHITDGFLQVALSAPSPPSVYFESLDALRFEGPVYLEAVRDWLRRKYAERRIDLVVTIGTGPLVFLTRMRGEPWPDAPRLFVELGVRADTRDDLPRTGGMLLEDTFAASLAVIKEILPETERVVLAYGGSAVTRARHAGKAGQVRAANLDLEAIVWADLSLETMLAEAAQLPPRTVVFLLAPYIDATGRVFSSNQLCEVLSKAASVPLFSLPAHDLGCGVVGGLKQDWALAGQVIADEALARLKEPSTEVVRVSPARYAKLRFDGRQLARWNISERRLPLSSEVLFREANLWRDRRALAIATTAVTLAQALLIAGLVFERRRRRRAELEGRRSLSAMAHLDRRAAMGELAASLAHEINQPLNAILQNAGVAHMMLTSSSITAPVGEVIEILEDIQSDDTRAGEVIRRMRALLEKRELEAKPVDVNAFARDTIALVLPDAAARGIQVETDLAEGLKPIQGDRVHLQQVLLNLLINGMDSVGDLPPDRRRLRVSTSERNGHVELSVRDRGTGIAADRVSQIFEAFYTTKGKGLGMGLSIARTIIEAHDGHIGAENNPDGGATVWFRVPARTSS